MENNEERMEPKKSPPGVRRVNKLPVILFFGLAAGIGVAGTYFAANANNDSKDDEETKIDSSFPTAEQMSASVIAPRSQRDVVPAKLANVPKEPEAPKEMPVVNPEPPKVDPEMESIRQRRMQALEEANKASPSIKGFGVGNQQATVQQANGQQLAAGVSSQGDRWTLGKTVEAPASDYMVRAGAVIPGMMVTGINSELSGTITAQVSQNVYDTATGSQLIIPRGTKLVGAYTNDIIYGQKAVLVAWQRLTFPDAKVLDIGEMPGADAAGYSGFRDQVDNHYVRIFGSALLMSAISAGTAISQNGLGGSNNVNGGSQQNANTVMSQVLGQQLGQVTTQMISKNMNIAPTIMISQGYKFNVIVTKDLVVPSSYINFDYKG